MLNSRFHLVHELERGQPPGPGELSEIHAEVVMGGGRVRFARERQPASRDTLFRQGGAPGLVGGELGQVKTGTAELPGGVAWPGAFW